MSIQLYNTLTKTKEPFKPLEEGKVKLYLCGPTVYDLLHIGNFRGAIFFNLLRNWMELSGLDVTFVYNYTDVDDKIIKKANEEGVESTVISERYIKEFEQDFNRLGLKKHDHNPRVTEFMPQIIKFVEDLVKNEKAYVIEGEVFYSIDSFDTYGKLSGKNIDDLEAGQRVEVDKRKKNPFDFVLWKPSKDGEPSWDSPWGGGRPGWHIECSAMIQSLLGDTIDIHGGGIDLIFPHHENEIAQGEGRTGKCYCNTWVHNEFINLSDEKMSKSLGNVITGRSFMDKWHPEILKYLFLSVHYRSQLAINDDKIRGAISALARIYTALSNAHQVTEFEGGGVVNKSFANTLSQHDAKIKKNLDDDFNTGEVVASVFEVVRAFNSLNLLKKAKDKNSRPTAEAFLAWLKKYGDMMALFGQDPSKFMLELDDILISDRKLDKSLIEELVAKRNEARDSKDWALADKYRDELSGMGIELQDGNPDRQWCVSKS
ncbi:MAG: cysteine--tRNA ligase [Bacteriovoracaceae bacterium]|nr:cysteine--tRNA ligase [Bacteriovoracaceae bacterium]